MKTNMILFKKNIFEALLPFSNELRRNPFWIKKKPARLKFQ